MKKSRAALLVASCAVVALLIGSLPAVASMSSVTGVALHRNSASLVIAKQGAPAPDEQAAQAISLEAANILGAAIAAHEDRLGDLISFSEAGLLVYWAGDVPAWLVDAAAQTRESTGVPVTFGRTTYSSLELRELTLPLAYLAPSGGLTGIGLKPDGLIVEGGSVSTLASSPPGEWVPFFARLDEIRASLGIDIEFRDSDLVFETGISNL